MVTWVAPRQSATVETVGAAIGYTWHLSVINGGLPRDLAKDAPADEAVWQSARHVNQVPWGPDGVDQARWVLAASQAEKGTPATRTLVFGIRGGFPIAGDFNGDGLSEVGVFYRGEWFVDLNGNGVWDESDLWAKLGDELDRPVVGDWDGDGKDDIGIYGPEWFGDQRQIDRERGLPDSQNLHVVEETTTPKNVPPATEEATDGQRLLQLGAKGPRRSDVIDHVLRYGEESHAPVAGDWNGDGIRTIGVFHGGEWRVDQDGDGILEKTDPLFRFGTVGDIPVVGDWNGDGIEEIGVYRQGRWILDVNGNRELDVHDKVFEMGGAVDRPVVGDWNGDGVDDPGLYREQPPGGEVPVRT